MEEKYSPDQCITYSEMNLIFNARNLWRELATWTRSLLISKAMGIGNEEEVFTRLYEIPREYASMLNLIFGNKISEDYMNLLSSQIVLINDLITAQMAGDAEKFNNNAMLLYDNADKRAAFLASINPFWDENQWRTLIYAYIYDTLEEITTFISGNYAENINIYDRLLEHASSTSDYFSEGLFDYITFNPEQEESPGQVQCYDRLSGHVKQEHPGYTDQCITYDQMNTIYGARNFWYELATWTRAYLISIYAGVGNADEVLARLKRVPQDYRQKLEQVFGNEYTEDYMQLLYSHIALLDAFTAAEMKEDTEAASNDTKLLYKNADERAEFLARINPFWSEDEWRDMLYNYIRSTIDESTTFLTGAYERNIDIFDRLLTDTENIGDYFSQGIFYYLGLQKSNEIQTKYNRLFTIF